MDAMLTFLSGKKTYFMSGLGLLVIALWIFGVIDEVIAGKALAALGFGGAITLRSAVAKSEAQAVATAQQVASLRRGDGSMVG